METEIWKDVIGYEGYYQVSNLARVRSIDRTVPHSRDGERKLKGKVLSPCISPDGYLLVNLTRNSKQKGFGVHRLVALAFIPNPFNHPVINHKDGNKLNNNISNLEWCTSSHNAKHAAIMGLNTFYKGEEQTNSKLTDEKVVELRKLRESGKSWNELSKIFKISKTTAFDACSGKSWKHIDYQVYKRPNRNEYLKLVKKQKV